jgi:hypothetical protein
MGFAYEVLHASIVVNIENSFRLINFKLVTKDVA